MVRFVMRFNLYFSGHLFKWTYFNKFMGLNALGYSVYRSFWYLLITQLRIQLLFIYFIFF